jgi:splicing factor 3B subunit 3
MISAVEKNKLVYVLNRNENGLAISSPLEAHRSKLLSLCTVALDVGYENPQFASLEIDYGDYEGNNHPIKKHLTYYELDLGLNHVTKKHTEQVSPTANLLISVPGGNDGPGGVLVCSQNMISYRNLHDDKLSIMIPGSQDSSIITGVSHKLKNEFFFMLQTNHGDLFKLELLQDMSLAISYFDTIPICSDILILKSGFMFADCETGDKNLYQFEKLGRDLKFTSHDDYPKATNFHREELENLSLVDILESLSPMITSHLVTDDQQTTIYSLNGTLSSSTLRLLQYGISITEVVEPDLPQMATHCFTIKTHKADEYDKYLIISFSDRTLVLTIGESVEEVTDSGIDLSVQTVGIQQIGKMTLLQIHNDGVNIIQDGKITNRWYPPAGIKIVASTSTNRQLALGLSSDELVYFEVDQEDHLIEWNDHKQMAAKISSLSLGEIPQGLLRSPILVIGCEDSTIRVLSTDPKSPLDSLSLQALSAIPTSLLVCLMNRKLCINIGMENGVYVRTILDPLSGELTDTKMKYLGNKAVTLSRSVKDGDNVVLALSNKTWIIHESETFKVQPMLIQPLKDAASFQTEDCPEGLVGVYKRKLIICNIDSLKEDFKKDSIPLKTTGKGLVCNDQALFISMNGEVSHMEKFNLQSHEFEQTSTLIAGFEILTSNVIHFESKDQTNIIVSTSNGSVHYLETYSLDLQLVHKTSISSPCHSLVEFQGKLLCGVGSNLRLFDIGVKQLLSKCNTQVKTLNQIVRLDVQSLRVAVGDFRESITLMTYSLDLNEFVLFVDDAISRHITSLKFLDYNTVIGGDKFGNLFVLRVPEGASDDDPGYLSTKPLNINGAPYKFDALCQFYLDDIPMNFHKTSFTPGGRDVVLYSGLLGTIGALIPLVTMSDIKFFQNLENTMRKNISLETARMHLKYRGYYVPVKNIIDGDLVELYDRLDANVKESIGEKLGKKTKEISKRVYDVRLGSI